MFLAVNADNLTDFDLGVLIDAHRCRPGRSPPCRCFMPRSRSECGIVEVDDGVVVGYVEKPANPPSDLANAGIYAFHPSVLDEIVGPAPRDIGLRPAPQAGRQGAGGARSTAATSSISVPRLRSERASDEWEGRLVK